MLDNATPKPASLLHILCVDDEAVLDSYKLLLELMGFRVRGMPGDTPFLRVGSCFSVSRVIEFGYELTVLIIQSGRLLEAADPRFRPLILESGWRTRGMPGDTPTTVRHGSCRLRLKLRYDGAEIGEGPAGRFRLHMRRAGSEEFCSGFY